VCEADLVCQHRQRSVRVTMKLASLHGISCRSLDRRCEQVRVCVCVKESALTEEDETMSMSVGHTFHSLQPIMRRTKVSE